MSSQNSKPTYSTNEPINESWFTKFFIGSMISIAFLTIILSFLPSQNGLRTQPQNKVSSLMSISTQALLPEYC